MAPVWKKSAMRAISFPVPFRVPLTRDTDPLRPGDSPAPASEPITSRELSCDLNLSPLERCPAVALHLRSRGRTRIRAAVQRRIPFLTGPPSGSRRISLLHPELPALQTPGRPVKPGISGS